MFSLLKRTVFSFSTFQMDGVVQGFFGVYILVSESPKHGYTGRTYIGKTTDPNRRIHQHNAGASAGGAWKTSNRGPWEMVMIVHGFPNEISALKFEWAWQHPEKSRRLKDIGGLSKRRSENSLQHRFRILSYMLSMEPWNRLPLVIRWINEKYAMEFPLGHAPPLHMSIVYGRIQSKRLLPSTINSSLVDSKSIQDTCFICSSAVEGHQHVSCYFCSATYHLACLANVFILEETGHADCLCLPVKGTCPSCKKELFWGDLILYRKGADRTVVKMVDIHSARNIRGIVKEAM